MLRLLEFANGCGHVFATNYESQSLILQLKMRRFSFEVLHKMYPRKSLKREHQLFFWREGEFVSYCLYWFLTHRNTLRINFHNLQVCLDTLLLQRNIKKEKCMSLGTDSALISHCIHVIIIMNPRILYYSTYHIDINRYNT